MLIHSNEWIGKPEIFKTDPIVNTDLERALLGPVLHLLGEVCLDVLQLLLLHDLREPPRSGGGGGAPVGEGVLPRGGDDQSPPSRPEVKNKKGWG